MYSDIAINNEEDIILQELENRLKVQNSLMDFYKAVYPKFIPGKHIDKIVDALEKVEQGKIKRLIISLPPRHSKSNTASIIFPCWYLGRNPSKRIVLTSYSQGISDEQCKKAKELFLHEDYSKYFDVKIGNKNTDNNWETSKGGSYYSVGIQGSLTGRGFDLGICDDHCKDRLDASSETYRRRTIDWYKSTFYTRQSKDAAIIIIATRWGQDDLTGYLLQQEAQGGEKWEKVVLPAINEDGEALWPEVFNKDKLEVIKKTIGDFEWNALYQQEPVSRSGNLFKVNNMKIYNNDVEFPKVRYIRVWDIASSKKQRDSDNPDYTCSVLCAVTKVNGMNNLWLKDYIGFREEAPKRNQIIKNIAVRDGPSVNVFMEAFGGYKDAYSEMKEVLRGISNVYPSRMAGDKVVKAAPMEVVFDSGNVHAIKNSYWDLLYKQLIEFPNGSHDDFPDSLAAAYYELTKSKSGILIC